MEARLRSSEIRVEAKADGVRGRRRQRLHRGRHLQFGLIQSRICNG